MLILILVSPQLCHSLESYFKIIFKTKFRLIIKSNGAYRKIQYFSTEMGNYFSRDNNPRPQSSHKISQFTFGVKDMIQVKREKLVDSYYIYRQSVAAGSFGEVYKAIHKETKAVRAIKQIQRCHLENQFSILRQLDHPNIMKIYQMYQDGDFCYIVTEFYEGGSLADMLANRSYLKQTFVLKYMFQILSGINYLHSMNIIHGDIKPQNILLDETKERIYLADFGLSAYESARECSPTGTKPFMAPDGTRVFCQKKFDMWACGVTMHLLFTGKLPPQTERPGRGCCISAKTQIQGVSEQANDLLRKLLHLDPHSRISAKQALFHPWFNAIHEQFYCGSTEWLRQMVENMFRNSTKNSMQKLISFYIANFVVSKQKRKCFQYFVAFDQNLDGVITKEQFSLVLSKLNICSNNDKLFAMMDTNNSGKIDYAEFVTFVIDSDKLLQDYSLYKAFDWLDQNHDHHISREELQDCLNGRIPKETIDQVINFCDTNKNGFIQYDEFVKFIKT